MSARTDHRRKSVRLPGYDYGQAGAYFVTLVTEGRVCLLGEIIEDQVRLSEAGRIVQACWLAIPEHFSHAELGAFVVMPNHVHGIIVLHDRAAMESPPVGAQHAAPLPGHAAPIPDHAAPLPGHAAPIPDHAAPLPHDVAPLPDHAAPRLRAPRSPHVAPGSLGAIVRSYKAAVTREISRRSGEARRIWQRNYYEHVIRNERDHQNAHDYILVNPLNWEADDENRR